MLLDGVALGPGIGAWFTGRDPGAPGAGNLSHRRPHRPADLAAARSAVGARTATDPARWHLMRQVHGREVGIVDDRTPPGAELRDVDALVTAEPERPLVVLVADCVPVLLAGPGGIAAVHAGRRGVALGVVPAAVAALSELGVPPMTCAAAIGPAIGGCCYEVSPALRDEVGAVAPEAVATTRWGTPSLDLPAAVEAQLWAAGVGSVVRAEVCTRCDDEQRWFSHRADPDGGRHIGLVVRRVARPEAVGG
jgi:polyphenol oxidase